METRADFTASELGKAGSGVPVATEVCGTIWSEYRAEKRTIGFRKAFTASASWQQGLATFRFILTGFPVLCWLFC
jgi:hypothetical protein